MEQHLSHFVSTFTKSIKEKNAAIFAGAGLSAPAGFVNWKNLLRNLAQEINLDVDKENDLVAVAQYYFNEKGRNRHSLSQAIIEEFDKETSQTPIPNHTILASLPIQTYWTTNYDRLIEKSLEVAGKTPDIKITQENLSNNKPRRDAVVYKMHGDVSLAHEAVLTKDDYEGYNESRQLFTTALQGDLVSKTFLFIGFSFDDPNLEYILSRIRVLLGENQRSHYCLFKKIQRKDYSTDVEFNYAEIKQQLRINDLKRYSINALLISDYPVITEMLQAIKTKLFRSNIFISGAAKEYTPKSQPEALDFVHRLSYTLASKDYKIVSGFGLGIGSAVINGALEYHFSTNYRHLDEALLLRPFPQTHSGNMDEKERNSLYRTEMLKSAGIALFLFGNKEHKGGIELSDGMMEEFEIALQNKVIPIPIGATGYAAETLWEKVMASPKDFLPENHELLNAFEQIGDKNLSEDELIIQVIKIIGILQTQV